MPSSEFGDETEHRTERVSFTVGNFDDGFYVEDDGPGTPPKIVSRSSSPATPPRRTGPGSD